MRQAGKGISPLKRGDTIGIIAPSAPSERSRIEKGLAYLRSRGFKTEVALDPSEQYGKKKYLFSSASIEARTEALHQLFADDAISAVITTRGAYGSVELLPHLDWRLIRKNPKPLVGFSDTTALLLSLYQKAGVISVHGPTIESFSRVGENPEGEANADSLFRLLSRGSFKVDAALKPRFLGKQRFAHGPLLIGNLSVFVSLLGTPFEPECKRHILCIEEAGEKPYRVHRMLLQLKLARKFDRVAGVVLGSFKDCIHPQGLGPTIDDVFEDIFADAAFPVAHYPVFGHDQMNRALALGMRATLDSQGLKAFS